MTLKCIFDIERGESCDDGDLVNPIRSLLQEGRPFFMTFRALLPISTWKGDKDREKGSDPLLGKNADVRITIMMDDVT